MFAGNTGTLRLSLIVLIVMLSACAGQASLDSPVVTSSPPSNPVAEVGTTSDVVAIATQSNAALSVENQSPTPAFVDQDNDGIADADDQCKDTPSEATVNSRGCPLDTDGDSVADYLDACIGTPAGIEVDSRGCGFDEDHDGVPDWRDVCGGSPPYVPIGGNGCELDSDADGVVDSRDQCAGTPPGLEVEPMGCHLTDLLVLRGANFQSGSERLSVSAQRILYDLAATLKRHPQMRVSIVGHTDDRGSVTLNTQLSERRAQSAQSFLINLGVSAKILSVQGAAGAKPIAGNDTEAGRAQNRRVEMRMVEID